MPSLTPSPIAHAAIAEIIEEADNRYPNETGGVLLGWTLGGVPYIREVLGPGPDATHGATGFHPDSDWQEGAIAEAYDRSGRRLTYLGDWHTHPRGVARPSRLDRATMRAIARHAPARCPQPLMLIVAGEPRHWTPALHQRLAGVRSPASRVLERPLELA